MSTFLGLSTLFSKSGYGKNMCEEAGLPTGHFSAPRVFLSYTGTDANRVSFWSFL